MCWSPNPQSGTRFESKVFTDVIQVTMRKGGYSSVSNMAWELSRCVMVLKAEECCRLSASTRDEEGDVTGSLWPPSDGTTLAGTRASDFQAPRTNTFLLSGPQLVALCHSKFTCHLRSNISISSLKCNKADTEEMAVVAGRIVTGGGETF